MIRYSVIVPVYNEARFLQACIDSVAAQTLADWELILIDDGSTDGSSRLCDHAAGGKIRVLHQTHRGVSAARNAGLDMAQGEFILFLDADDILAGHALHVVDQAIARADVLLFRSTRRSCALERSGPSRGVRAFDGDEIAGLIPTVVYSEERDALHGLNCNTVTAAVYRRGMLADAQARFDERLRIGEDKLFNLRVFQHTRSLRAMDNRLYLARPHACSATRAYMPDALSSNAPLLNAMRNEIDGMPDGVRAACLQRMPCAAYQVVRNALTLDDCHPHNRASLDRRGAHFERSAALLLDCRALPRLCPYDRYMFTLFHQPFKRLSAVMRCRPLRLAGYALYRARRLGKRRKADE